MKDKLQVREEEFDCLEWYRQTNSNSSQNADVGISLASSLSDLGYRSEASGKMRLIVASFVANSEPIQRKGGSYQAVFPLPK